METEASSENLAALREVATKRTDAVVIVDLRERKVFVSNTTATKIFGIHTGDTIEKMEQLINSVSPADREYIKNKYQQVSSNPAVSGIEFRLINNAGKTIWVSAETVTLDKNRYVFGVARDITHDKEHENYLVEYGSKKNTVLDTVVHQLSGALALMNNLALSADKLSVTSDQSALETFLSLMRENSKHCIKIIDDLIRVEYTESPGIHVKLSRIDVVKSLSYIFEEFKKNDGHRKFVFDSPVSSLFINTDDFKLLQVMNNLASNAIKFTRENDEIKIGIREFDTTILITVSDTGIGIPEPLQPFVFEKLGPAGRTGLNGQKSNGLGLSICNHLVQLIGGRIWFESQEEVGSTFFIGLPKD
jgi:two-component system, OmpR family, sensor histidine kinase VicK